MNATEPNCDKLLEFLRAALSAETGVDFEGILRHRADSALRSLRRRRNVENAAALHSLLQEEPQSFARLMSEVMVGETYFFREPAQFAFLKDTILPDRGERGLAALPPRIWCAGCATGEEAYSLAIALRESGYGEGARILATDISAGALESARAASFRSWSFRDAGVRVPNAYASPSGGGLVTLVAELRHAVEFKQLNLMQPLEAMRAAGAHDLDLIFCRNVLVYFEAGARAEVFSKFFACLAPGGWLVTAASDPMPPPESEFTVVAGELGVFFRRPLETETATATDSFALLAGAASSVDAASLASAASPTEMASLGDETFLDWTPPVLTIVETAITQHEPGIPQTPKDELTDLKTSIRLLANRDPRAAAQACGAARTRFPADPELLILEAATLQESGDPAGSERALRALLFLDRSTVVAHLLLARLLLRRGDARSARKSLENARSLLRPLPRDTAIPLADGASAGMLTDSVDAELARLLEGSLD